MITAKAPAKIIISGEHAVVYGNPALASAINLFAITKLVLHNDNKIIFNISDFNYRNEFSFAELLKNKIEIQNRYTDVNYNSRSHMTLQNVSELFQFALILFIEQFSLSIKSGLEFNISSNIPIGCGLGSSAAVIVSFLRALVKLFALPEDNTKILHCAKDIENLIHAKSSGLDLAVSLSGDSILFQNGEMLQRQIHSFPKYLINTGNSRNTTGECVKFVEIYLSGQKILQDFAAVTLAIDEAVQADDLTSIKYYIKENHKLLKYIKVVPNKVQNFITEIEAQGLAAKICGAGAISGENAGIVLVVGEGKINSLLHKYNYQLLQV